MKKISKIIFIASFLLILAALLAAGYFYKQYDDIKKNPSKVTTDEIKSLLTEIGKFTDLPTDETPTLATVTDISKLQDQEFFKKAQNGDKILIYATTRKVILYRPSTKKIIEFSTLLIGDSSQSATPTTTMEETE